MQSVKSCWRARNDHLPLLGSGHCLGSHCALGVDVANAESSAFIGLKGDESAAYDLIAEMRLDQKGPLFIRAYPRLRRLQLSYSIRRSHIASLVMPDQERAACGPPFSGTPHARALSLRSTFAAGMRWNCSRILMTLSTWCLSTPTSPVTSNTWIGWQTMFSGAA